MNGRLATIDASKVSASLRSPNKRATAPVAPLPSARLGAFLGGNLGYITNEGTGRKMVANGRLDSRATRRPFPARRTLAKPIA